MMVKVLQGLNTLNSFSRFVCISQTFALFLFQFNSQTISYAQIVSGNSYDSIGSGSDVYATDPQTNQPIEYAEATICPYIQSTITRADGTISCKYGDRCPYQHGELCEICGLYCLHPTDQNQRKQHEKVRQQFCHQIVTI